MENVEKMRMAQEHHGFMQQRGQQGEELGWGQPPQPPPQQLQQPLEMQPPEMHLGHEQQVYGAHQQDVIMTNAEAGPSSVHLFLQPPRTFIHLPPISVTSSPP
jgi:hypothetical protein